MNYTLPDNLNLDLKNRFGAEEYAKHLLRSTGLAAKGWTFAWNNHKRSFGLCSYSKKTIYLSRFNFPHVPAKHTRDTIIHEVAHAIAGPRAKHGPEWKAVMRAFGIRNPKACSKGNKVLDEAHKRAASWKVYCQTCNWEQPRHRRPKASYFVGNRICAGCRNPVSVARA